MDEIIISKENLNNLINKYTCKKQLCEDLNISIPTLNKYLKKYDLIFNFDRKRKYPEIDKDWFILNWINTDKSLYQLAEEYNISYGLLDNRARSYGLSKKYKFQFNKIKFFDLADPHIYYLAGLIATDGYLESNHDAFSITLTGESEFKLLFDILIYYESSSSINTYNNKNHQIRFAADGLKEFLYKNFCISDVNKTFTVKTPIKFYNEDCAKAYVLGCFDGDGCISKNGRNFTLTCGSSDLVTGLHDIIQFYTDINLCVYLEKRKNKVFPTLSGSRNKGKHVLDWIYSLNNCFKLERKYNRYKVDDIV